MMKGQAFAVSGLFRRIAAKTLKSNGPVADAFPALLGAIAQQPSVRSTASALATKLVAQLGARSARVYIADDTERTLRLEASVDVHGASPAIDVIDVDAHAPVARAARTRALELSDAVGELAFPLFADDRLIGAVSVELAKRLDPNDVASLESLAIVIGVIVDRARRVEETRRRDEWTEVVVHEIRQPLNTMSFAAALISNGVAGEGSVGATRCIVNGAKRVNHLLGDLLDTSLHRVADVALIQRPTDLVQLARTLAHESRGVRVLVREPVPEIAVDAERIQQVLSNLIVNAKKYGTVGVEIVLELGRRQSAVVVSVTNEGSAIPAEERPFIFERYYRAGNSCASHGAGIGLYVCRALVEAHGGRIDVDCAGGATTFSFTLPCPDADQAHFPESARILAGLRDARNPPP